VHYTDPKTGTFHVGYLYGSENSSGAAGALTDDLVTYRDVNPGEPLFIRPGGINDPVMLPANLLETV
jgi:beta-fructofuranosidase